MTKRIHGGDAVKVAQELGFKKGNLIDFSANINPLGPSDRVVKKIKESIQEIIHYPDPECYELREALKGIYPVTDENLIFGNGASELIFILMKVLSPEKVLIPAPTFIEYQFAAESVGSQVHFLNMDYRKDFTISLEDLENMAASCDVFFLCNPNNPTGTLLNRGQVREIAEISRKKNLFLVLDEAFMDFLTQEEEYSFLFEEDIPPNIFILRSMTKFFALPGLRLGWGSGPAEIIEKMHLSKDPWNVNSLAQAAGKESLLDTNYIKQTREYIRREKWYLYQELLNRKEIKPYFPSVNYIFVELKDRSISSSRLREVLAHKGVLIRDCSNYPNLDSRFIRIAVRKREENEKFIKILNEVLESVRRGVGPC